MRSLNGPTVSFQRYIDLKSRPWTMQPPGKRMNFGFKSASAFTMSLRQPFLAVKISWDELISSKKTPSSIGEMA